jgi:hypothetical protein
MRLIFYLAGINLLSFSQCNSFKQNSLQENPKVVALRLYSQLPVGFNSTQVINWNDSLDLYLYKDIVVYRIFGVNVTNLMGFNKTADTIVPKQTHTEVSSTFYGAKKGYRAGYYFNPLNAGQPRMISIDSMRLKHSAYFGFNKLYLLAVGPTNTMVESINLGNGDLLEKYIPKVKLDQSYADTSLFYYTNNEGVKALNFSLSRDADSLKGMKLYKFMAIYNGDPNSPDEYGKYSKTVTIEFKQILVQNEEEIMNIIEKTDKCYRINKSQ